MVEVRVHSAKVRDEDGVRRLLEPARGLLPRLSHLWVDAGYHGRGKDWVEERLGLEVEIVNRTPKLPEKVLKTWAREWFKDGRKMDLKKLPERPAFENLLWRWVAERTFAWISHNRRMGKDHERLCSIGEAGACLRVCGRSTHAVGRTGLAGDRLAGSELGRGQSGPLGYAGDWEVRRDHAQIDGRGGQRAVLLVGPGRGRGPGPVGADALAGA